MKGQAVPLASLFNSHDRRFVIPVYQRNFDWKAEQCERLLNDLKALMRGERKTHFFGCIVSQIKPEAPEERIVIDGQQRITTCFLMLLALLHQIEAKKIKTVDPEAAGDKCRAYFMDEYKPGEVKLRLKLTKNDQDAFDRIVETPDDLINDSNVTSVYEFFKSRFDQSEIKHPEFSAEDFLAAFDKLIIIDICLGAEDDAQLIFESLNSAGLSLSEGDKIRNFLLMSLPVKDQEDMYRSHWKRIEERTNFRLSEFFRDYLTVQNSDAPVIRRVYAEYRKFFEDKKQNAKEQLEDLLRYAELYNKIGKAEQGDEQVRKVQTRLNLLGMTVINPYLLALYRDVENHKISNEDQLKALQAVESYLFRRFVCKLPANALNKVFETLHGEAMKAAAASGYSYASVIICILRNKKGSAAFPDDAEFSDAILSRDFFPIGDIKFYLFDRLENGDSCERIDVIGSMKGKTCSIEHIMPQKLSDGWKNDLGTDWERIHKQWCNRLANLTLTGYNSDLSNQEFLKKRDAKNGYAQSPFRLNKFVKERDSWGEPELKKRAELLQKTALELWPLPPVTVKWPIEREQFSLADDPELSSGRKLASFEFMGTQYAAKSWTRMELSVLAQIDNDHRETLRRVVRPEIDPSKKQSPGSQFTDKEDKLFQKVSEGLYVFTNMGTAAKLRLLAHVFDACGIDRKKLVFELYPKKPQ